MRHPTNSLVKLDRFKRSSLEQLLAETIDVLDTIDCLKQSIFERGAGKKTA